VGGHLGLQAAGAPGEDEGDTGTALTLVKGETGKNVVGFWSGEAFPDHPALHLPYDLRNA
jgi:hypothetical protein